MATFAIPIGGVVRTVTYCSVPGQVATNTHKWQLTSLSSGTSFDSLAVITQFDNDLAPLYKALLANEAQYYGNQIYLMNPVGPPPRPDSISASAGAGTAGSGLLPTQSCGLISLYSTTLGKIGQGRSYIPFPCVDDCFTDGTPITTYVTRLADLALYLKNQVLVTSGGITATFRPVLYRGGTDVPRFIETANNHDAWATQRRRGSYGRLNSLPF